MIFNIYYIFNHKYRKIYKPERKLKMYEQKKYYVDESHNYTNRRK